MGQKMLVTGCRSPFPPRLRELGQMPSPCWSSLPSSLKLVTNWIEVRGGGRFSISGASFD